MSTNVYRGRLAPSPTGALHIGNIRTFVYTWLHCRMHDGELVMRMEDLGIVKLKEGAVYQVYDDLIWLGLDWDKGAGLTELGKEADPAEKDYIQSFQIERYQVTFQKLLSRGLVYPCSCTRKDIQMAQFAPHEERELGYPNTCRNRWPSEEEAAQHKGQDPCWRFLAQDGVTSFEDEFYGKQESEVSKWSGDFIIAQTKTRIAYQLAVVVDDAYHGINHVIRGDDLLSSTHRQLHLFHTLDLKPPKFTHLPLVVGPDGIRLAKRHGDLKIKTLRELGNSVEKILGFIAYSFGWADWAEELNIKEMQKRFNRESISKDPFVIEDKHLEFFGLSSKGRK